MKDGKTGMFPSTYVQELESGESVDKNTYPVVFANIITPH